MFFDPFDAATDSLIAPAQNVFAITPDDTADVAMATKAIYVGSAGDLTLLAVGSAADVTFANVPAGTILPVRTKSVKDSGTTAGNIVGLA